MIFPIAAAIASGSETMRSERDSVALQTVIADRMRCVGSTADARSTCNSRHAIGLPLFGLRSRAVVFGCFRLGICLANPTDHEVDDNFADLDRMGLENGEAHAAASLAGWKPLKRGP